jgi:hypothetical protein
MFVVFVVMVFLTILISCVRWNFSFKLLHADIKYEPTLCVRAPACARVSLCAPGSICACLELDPAPAFTLALSFLNCPLLAHLRFPLSLHQNGFGKAICCPLLPLHKSGPFLGTCEKD